MWYPTPTDCAATPPSRWRWAALPRAGRTWRAAPRGHPTLSRLESSVVEGECEAINFVLLEQFLACSRKPPREVVLDFDTSEDPLPKGRPTASRSLPSSTPI